MRGDDASMDRQQFGSRLREYRVERGWTQAHLGRRMAAEASHLGKPISPVAKSTISSYEKGQRPPEPFYALLLCRALQRDTRDLGLDDVLTDDRIQDLTVSLPGLTGTSLPPSLPTPHVPVIGALGSLPLDWERVSAMLAATR